MEMSNMSHLLQVFIQVLMNALKTVHNEALSNAAQPLFVTSNILTFAGWEEDEEDAKDDDSDDDDDDDFEDDDDDWYTDDDDDDDFDDDDEEDDEDF